MRPTDPDMCTRTAAELRKLGKSPTEIGRLLGCKQQLVSFWMREEGVPCAMYLKKLHGIGCDIMYIITGERRGEP